eukprot:4490194-Prymnesium_polylepis.2
MAGMKEAAENAKQALDTKLKQLEQVSTMRKKILVSGCFDLLHSGCAPRLAVLAPNLCCARAAYPQTWAPRAELAAARHARSRAPMHAAELPRGTRPQARRVFSAGGAARRPLCIHWQRQEH